MKRSLVKPAFVCALALLPALLPLVAAPAAVSAPTEPPLIPRAFVKDIGTVGQNPLIYGRDGTFSTLFKGKSIWAFGDTPLAVPGASGDSWQDNTLSWTSDLDASDGITLEGDLLDATGAPVEFLPHTKRERRYNYTHDADHCTREPCDTEFALWPGPPVADPERNRVLFFYTEIWRKNGQPTWRNVGSGIATWTPGRGVERPIENPGNPTPTLMWGADELAYTGGSVLVEETLYSYGCKPGFLVQHCHVARVPLADALDKSRWRYFAGGGTWSTDPDDAVQIFDGGAAGNSVVYVPYLRQYVAIYSGVFTDDVFYRVANTPWGPWSEQELLFTAREGWNDNWSYAAEAHPEFAQANGRIQYVAYVHPTGFLRWDLPLVKVVFARPDR